MNEEMYVVTAVDGNRFVSFQYELSANSWGGRWVATSSGGKIHLFAEGYIIEWVKI